MHTFTSALALIGVGVPGHLAADAEVPVLSTAQAQGDLLIFPAELPPGPLWQDLPPSGVQLIHGEATGNTHWLHPGFDSRGVRWVPIRQYPGERPPVDDDAALALAYLDVPAGQSALLIHTDEHGANGIGPGRYAIHRKRQASPAKAARTQSSWDYTAD
jgi:hypothetical protein